MVDGQPGVGVDVLTQSGQALAQAGDAVRNFSTEGREILEALVAQVLLRPIGKVGPVRARTMVPQTTEVVPA